MEEVFYPPDDERHLKPKQTFTLGKGTKLEKEIQVHPYEEIAESGKDEIDLLPLINSSLPSTKGSQSL